MLHNTCGLSFSVEEFSGCQVELKTCPVIEGLQRGAGRLSHTVRKVHCCGISEVQKSGKAGEKNILGYCQYHYLEANVGKLITCLLGRFRTSLGFLVLGPLSNLAFPEVVVRDDEHSNQD